MTEKKSNFEDVAEVYAEQFACDIVDGTVDIVSKGITSDANSAIAIKRNRLKAVYKDLYIENIEMGGDVHNAMYCLDLIKTICEAVDTTDTMSSDTLAQYILRTIGLFESNSNKKRMNDVK